MKANVMSSLGLIVKILVIVLLPIILFYYIDTQPANVTTKDEDDEGTRKIAIVNEDNGFLSGDDEIELGKEISSLLAKRDRYAWTVENRNGAEKKFAEEKYDGILYIPSNFSENVMNFKATSPLQADVNYVVQPNLDAKERQRVHREMSDVKHIVNKEMSTIYWSYVAQEVDHIQEQFDDILEKEIAFQEAIYAFYAPTSEKLANEIESYKERLSMIVEQTGSIDDVVSDNIADATDTEQRMEQLLQSFSAYKELQEEQQQLFDDMQRENRSKVETGVDAFEEAFYKYMSTISTDMREYEHPEFHGREQIREIRNRYDEVQGEIEAGKDELNDWEEGEHADTYARVVSLNEKFLQEYNYAITRNTKTKVLDTISALDERESDGENGDFAIEDRSSSIDMTDVEQRVRELKQVAESLRETTANEFHAMNTSASTVDGSTTDENEKSAAEAANEVDEAAGEEELAEAEEVQEPQEVTIAVDFQPLNKAINNVEQSIETLEDAAEEDDDTIEELEQLIEELYEQLEQLEAEVYGPLIDRILSLQQQVRNSSYKEDIFTEDEIEELLAAFLDRDELETKTAESLLNYVNELEVFNRFLETGSEIDQGLVEELLEVERLQEELQKLYDIDLEMIEKLQGIFDRLLGNDEEEEEGHLDVIERNFDQLLYRTYRLLREYDESLEQLFSDISHTVHALETEADHILRAIQLTDDDMFVWEPSIQAEETEGELVYQLQRGTVTNLDNVKNLIGSLNEQQERVSEDTSKLHSNIYGVQSESDDLNERWAANVLTTERIRDDVHDILDNAVIDGQENFSVYDYLTNPVQIDEKAGGQVLSEREDRMPPVILLMIILISGLLIGFITHYYSHNSYVIQKTLFILLNLGVGILIGYYGINLYPLPDSRAVIWIIFTIILLAATSNIVRGGLFINPFVGWLMSIGLIIFYTTPLLNIVVPEFHFYNPISNIYIGMLYQNNVSYGIPLFVLSLIIVIVSALIYTLQIYRNEKKVAEEDEKEAS